MLRPLAWLTAGTLLAVPPLQAQHSADADGVRRAALDYLEGFYEGDSTKLMRSIRRDVTKYGFYRRDASAAYAGTAMSFQQMLDFARNVRENGESPPASAPKEVEILDLLDQTAAVKVTAWWGTDYLHLAKYDGRWMIAHVLWQSAPEG